MENNIGEYLAFIVQIVFIIGICSTTIAFIKGFFNNEISKLSMKRFEVIANTSIDKDTPQLLEDFIINCFDEYKALNLPPDMNGFAEYVTDDKEAEIRSDLAEIVGRRISPVLLDKLSMYYNTDTIDKVMADKIYMVVMTYAIQTRIPHQEKNNYGNLNDIITTDLK